MVIFHSYVKLPEGTFPMCSPTFPKKPAAPGAPKKRRLNFPVQILRDLRARRAHVTHSLLLAVVGSTNPK